jgi:hypothetical protein
VQRIESSTRRGKRFRIPLRDCTTVVAEIDCPVEEVMPDAVDKQLTLRTASGVPLDALFKQSRGTPDEHLEFVLKQSLTQLMGRSVNEKKKR